MKSCICVLFEKMCYELEIYHLETLEVEKDLDVISFLECNSEEDKL